MDNNTFNYCYSALENKEVLKIRDKYLPKAESKFDELKRLDRNVQTAGLLSSLSLGVCSSIVFGFGLCLSMNVIGNNLIWGITLGCIGIIGMLFAYPVNRIVFSNKKAKLTPRILELITELSNEAA